MGVQAELEQIQRKSRVREKTPQNAPRIRAGVEKKDQKAELKKNQTRRRYVEKTSIFFRDDRQTPARREARNHRSEDAEMLGPLPSGPQRTGRADQRDARGDANRDRITQNHRRRVLLCATQRPRSTDNETTTTTRAALDTLGLVREHKYVMTRTPHVRWQKLRKKAALPPWVVAPISTAATPGAFAVRGGRRSRCSGVVDPHHDRRGEHRPSSPSFPLAVPASCPNANRRPPLW